MRIYALKWYDEKHLVTGIDGAILAFTSKTAARKFAREHMVDDLVRCLRAPNWRRYAEPVAFKLEATLK